MDYTIEPHVGVGPLKFGMSAEEIRSAVGATPRTFLKTRWSEMPTDDFFELGFHVGYRKPGVAEDVELFEPATPTLNGQPLLGIPFDELLRWFRTIDPEVEVDDSGLTSKRFGVGLYSPVALSDPGVPPEGVIVFERGYYERARKGPPPLTLP